ncbi:unnamed protein product [Caenorhabditis bovis]|uniref:Heme transporter hrg-1 n=1 Tax=Caenorhabditis bovis TaxID=2654633 RepID=A0A8S1F2T6_9PELO|nr:unnamed protein product [Caenorhabditis bovis]
MHRIYSQDIPSIEVKARANSKTTSVIMEVHEERRSFCTWFHSLKVQIWIAWLGVSAGIMAGTVFAIQFQNWPAVFMAYVSSAVATMVLHLHMAYKKTQMAGWSMTKLKCISTVGATLSIISFIAMIYCLVTAGVEGQTITPEGLKGPNLWITAVWFFMTFKWSMFMWKFSWKYRLLCEETQPLLQSPPEYSVIV